MTEHQDFRDRRSELALSVLAALPDASVLVCDRDLNIALATGAPISRHGWSSQEMEGRALADAVPAEFLHQLEPHSYAALAGDSGSFEYTSPDGTRTYQVTVSPAAAGGERFGCLVISRDVTKRWLAEEALARSERKYRALAENSSDIVTRSDANLIYQYVSPACTRVYGRQPEELLGQSVTAFMHPDDRPAHARLRAALLEGEDEQVLERRFLCANGDWGCGSSRAVAH